MREGPSTDIAVLNTPGNVHPWCVSDPVVRARRVHVDVCAGVSRHHRFAEHASAEVRHDERQPRIREREPRDAERVAEAQVESTRQARASSARRPTARRSARTPRFRVAPPPPRRCVRSRGSVERHMMHRGEQARDTQPQRRHCVCRPLDRLFSGRVDHEEADESIRDVSRHRSGDRRLVSRHAGDQSRSRDAVRVEFLYPAIRQCLRCARVIPLKLLAERAGRVASTSLARERREELARERNDSDCRSA